MTGHEKGWKQSIVSMSQNVTELAEDSGKNMGIHRRIRRRVLIGMFLFCICAKMEGVDLYGKVARILKPSRKMALYLV